MSAEAVEAAVEAALQADLIEKTLQLVVHWHSTDFGVPKSAVVTILATDWDVVHLVVVPVVAVVVAAAAVVVAVLHWRSSS